MILFVDVDGVLVPTDGKCNYSLEAATNVRAFVAAGYRVVIHSTLRCIPRERAKIEFFLRMIGCEAAGVTSVTEPSKARAIAAWLDDEFGPEWPAGVVVVDDDPIDLRGVTLIRPASAVGWVEPATVPAISLAHGVHRQ